MRGILITFEGIEGSGKSTQVERLATYLRSRGLDCVVSREPGGTELGERIRTILLDPKYQMDPLTELLLYLASRNQHVRQTVLPALQKGRVVILDRFSDSSVAYQGYGRGLGARLVSRLNRLATAGLKPHLTILVDLPVATGKQRKPDGKLDRLEQETVEFHERVRQGYLQLARRAAGRFKKVDGTLEPDRLAAAIRKLVDELLVRKGILR
ncbi:MAG: dTMP kinase [candidate division WOR-3 bacterium]